MGLDMYLDAQRGFYDSQWNKEETEESKVCKKIREIIPEIFKSGNLNYIKIKFEVGYWRKANAIHAWFVDNVQEGVDDCRNYRVSRNKLKELLAICKEVLKESTLVKGTVKAGWKGKAGGGLEPILEDGEKIVDSSVAEEILPTADGFFFGSTDYDEFYISDVKATIKIIEKALTLPIEWTFYYNSSW